MIGNKKSVILADQLKSLDWKSRKAKFIKKGGKSIIDEVMEKIGLLLG